MRKTITIVSLLILILTSCSSATPMPTPTDVPTHTATATATPLPTATHQPTYTPEPTATKEVQVGPSEEQLNQILQEVGVEFSKRTTNEVLDSGGTNRCNFGYSKDLLKRSQIDYIQFPEVVKNYMCWNMWVKWFAMERNNTPYLAEAYSDYPLSGEEQTWEIQTPMREKIKALVEEKGSVPFMFWTDGLQEVVRNDISAIDLNYVSKRELQAIRDAMKDGGYKYSSWLDSDYYNEQKPAPDWVYDHGEVIFFQGDRLGVFYYFQGDKDDKQPGGVRDPKNNGYTALELMGPMDYDYMYNAILGRYSDIVHYVKGLCVPRNELVARQNEWNGFYHLDPNVIFGENQKDRRKYAEQTLAH